MLENGIPDVQSSATECILFERLGYQSGRAPFGVMIPCFQAPLLRVGTRHIGIYLDIKPEVCSLPISAPTRSQ